MAANDVSIRFAAEGDQTLKSAVSAIDAQMRALNDQLKASTEGMKNLSTAEDASGKITEALTGIVAASQEKLKILGEQYETAKGKLDQLAEAMRKAQESGDPAAIDKATVAYNKQSAEVSKLEGAMARTEGEIAKATNAMSESGDETESLSDKVKKLADTMSIQLAQDALGKITSGMEKVGKAVADAGKAIWDMASESSTFADDILAQATQTGIATEKLQEYAYAARFVDTEVGTITGSLVKLTKNMSSSSSSVTEAFSKLGVATRDSNGALRDSQTVFWELIDSLGNVDNATERDTLAMELFGKSAQQLNPLIEAGSEEWNKYAQEAHDAGLILSDDAVGALGSFNDGLQRIDATMEAAQRQIMGALAPAFTEIANLIADAAQEITKWVQTDEGREFLGELTELVKGLAKEFLSNLQPAVQKAIEIFKSVSSAIEFLRQNFDKVVAVIQTAVTAYVSLKTAMAALQIAALVTNPIGAVVAAITGLIAAIGLLVTNWDKVKEAGKKAWETIKGAWDSAVSWFKQIGDGIVQAFTGIPSKIGEFFSQTWSKVQQAWNGAVSWFGQIGSQIVSAFTSIPGQIGNFFTQAWSTAQRAWSSAVSWFGQIGSQIVNGFTSIPSKIGSFFTTAWSNVQRAWSSATSYFSSIGSQIISAISQAISSLPSKALQWGKDMMEGFGRGISNFMSKVTEPVKSLASKIAGFLHFSRPDYGPLRDYETWMPDFIGGLAKTLTASQPVLDKAVASIAGGLEDGVKGITLSASQTGSAMPPMYLQVDGQTFARLMTPYIDSRQGSTWSASMALG